MDGGQNLPRVLGNFNLRNGQFKKGNGDWFISNFSAFTPSK
jgi:hypothetical protein